MNLINILKGQKGDWYSCEAKFTNRTNWCRTDRRDDKKTNRTLTDWFLMENLDKFTNGSFFWVLVLWRCPSNMHLMHMHRKGDLQVKPMYKFISSQSFKKVVSFWFFFSDITFCTCYLHVTARKTFDLYTIGVFLSLTKSVSYLRLSMSTLKPIKFSCWNSQPVGDNLNTKLSMQRLR